MLARHMRHGGSERGPLLFTLGGRGAHVPPVLSLADQVQGKRVALERGYGMRAF